MVTTRLFEVWNLTQQPPQLEARFRYYDDAASYIERQAEAGNYDIRFPDGHWSRKQPTQPSSRETRRPMHEDDDVSGRLAFGG
jgi:hypothetical protein